ncbi:transposase [Saccharopolyspora sp. NPDC000995]
MPYRPSPRASAGIPHGKAKTRELHRPRSHRHLAQRGSDPLRQDRNRAHRHHPCLWWGSLHRRQVTVVLVRETDSTGPYDIALVSTDTSASAETITARYADRWSVEHTIKDSKSLIGAGDTANRLRRAVERSVPFAMLGLTILILWYAANGTSDTDLATARTRAPGTARRTTSASTTCSSPSAGPE